MILILTVSSFFTFVFYRDGNGAGQEFQVNNYKLPDSTYRKSGFKDSLVNLGFQEAGASGCINGIILIKNGKIAAEKYFRNTNSNTIFEIKSVTKSFTSALIGNFIRMGYIGLDSKLTEILPEYNSTLTDPRINNITVRHLLTMTSGIKSDDYLFSLYDLSTDFVSKVMSSRLDNEPGELFRYSDVGAHLLSAIIAKKTKQSTSAFARSSIFDYLNSYLEKWDCDPQRIPFGGAGMHLTLKDMASLGVLYLNKGIYNSTQVVAEDWIAASTTDYTCWKENSLGKITNLGYGYLWWLGEITGHKVFFALGAGGQLVVCIPDLNIVVAASAPSDVDNYQGEKQRNKIIDIIADYFIPAAR